MLYVVSMYGIITKNNMLNFNKSIIFSKTIGKEVYLMLQEKAL